jgi:oxygen-dependent protoporphyrinogen oxidase
MQRDRFAKEITVSAAERSTVAVNEIGATRAIRAAVIGGGISGLAAAHRLTELAPNVEVTLLEASARLGGVLETVHREGFLIERSADGFITNPPWGVELARRVGLEPQLLRTSDGNRQAFVVHAGRLCKIPAGFRVLAPSRIWPIVASSLLSPWGKLRLCAERFVPRRSGRSADREQDLADESLSDFARRRLGREAYERLAQPLVGGIYTADPDRLSLAATMPRFLQMERDHGSLWRGSRETESLNSDAILTADQAPPTGESGARYSMFVAPRDGMSSLIDAIEARLPRTTVRRNAVVRAIERASPTQPSAAADRGWRLTIAAAHGADASVESFDYLIVATPAHQAALLLRSIDAALGDDLAGIEHASIAVVCLAYDRDQIKHPLDGFGYVTPLVERRAVLSGSFASVKYAGRAPDGKVLIRAFIGGACQAEFLKQSDTELRHLAQDDAAHLLGITGVPQLALVTRWNDSMPQYHLGHLDRVRRIETAIAAQGNLALCGNAYHGVGIPQCIHSGELAAERAVHYAATAMAN